MTPEERERFEKEVLHHADKGKDLSGPAGEPEVREKRKQPEGLVVPPNPD